MTSVPLPPHSPAELLLLLHPQHKPNLRQLLRITFLDLLRQQVLAVAREQARPHVRDPASWEQYVEAGPALTTHPALTHEKLLLTAFLADTQLRIPFRHYVRMVFEKARTAEHFRQLIGQNERTAQLFSGYWIWSLLHTRFPTAEGQHLRDTTTAELSRLDAEFRTHIVHHPTEVPLFVRQLGGALFLLPSFSSEIGRQLEHALQQLPDPASSYSGDGGGYFGDGGDGGSWHAHGDTFDSHAADTGHTDASDGDSGDGDSGGDSGCGGCGGD